ncbi:serine protease [Gigaspora margarita]|uniref:Serine protease n=1 Tax=Gigaspora margarita TaxID=4874 RepID=A0A8H3WYV3_GIGMA|nr:serine protease [Gigaspora margarita]
MKSIIYFFQILFLILQIYSVYGQLQPIYSKFEPLADLWGVAENEVPKLLATEDNLVTGNNLLTPLLNEKDFGGSYINVKTNKIYINIINISKKNDIIENLKMKNYIDLLEFKQVSNSLADLNDTFSKLIKFAVQCNATDFILSHEYKVNNIVLYCYNKCQKNSDFINYAKNFSVIINYLENEDLFPSSDLKFKYRQNNAKRNSPNKDKRHLEIRLFGGDGIHNEDEEDFKPMLCSAGFWVRNGSQILLATAGHCTVNGPYVEPPDDMSVDFLYLPWNSYDPEILIGRMSQYSTTAIDKGYILNENDRINAVPAIRNSDNPDFRELPIVGYLPLYTIGAYLCKSGYTTHVTCGVLNSYDAVHRIEMNGTLHDYFDVWVADLLSRPGDSGGPVFKFVLGEEGVRIVGMIIGAKIQNNISVFHPTDTILRRDDLSLMDLITVHNN